MSCMEPDILFRQERDAIAFLGTLSFMAFAFDPPIRTGSNVNDVTHRNGLNICALIIDNTDGQPIALGHNLIHQTEDPLNHAEQFATRAADDFLRIKRPRPFEMSVEDYYRGNLFYQPGTSPSDFLTKGCTLYTSLEPCPMCTATLCVARMKRIVYIVPDLTYGGSYDGRGMPPGTGIKDHYYAKYDMQYGALSLEDDVPGLTRTAKHLYDRIFAKIGVDKTTPGTLRSEGMFDTLFFDVLEPELKEIAEVFGRATRADLVTEGDARRLNENTLSRLQKVAKAPSAPLRFANHALY